MINTAAYTGTFGYHSTCRDIGLTHLCFADDILVFTDGTAGSLQGVMEVMDKFAELSGLFINIAKSSLYIAGAASQTFQLAADDMGIGIGSLPIRYLGLPLTTQSLSPLDYEPLIDKIRNQLLAWTNKAISYAGRLQLIKSVIVSSVNFWSSAYILPMGCLDKLESLCNAFLWSGTPNQHHKAKVAWEDICVPKEEGGLGIRRFRDTSKVFALNLIWKLFTLTDSYWVAWTRANLLRNSSFWEVKETQLGSWIWRKLLRIRPLAYSYIRKEVRNGRNTFFWHDDWLRKGKLIEITGQSGPTTLGLPINARVADAVSEDLWIFGTRRRRQHAAVIDYILQEPVPNSALGADITFWRHSNDTYCDTFSAAKSWEQLRTRKNRVDWAKIIWFPQAVPRFSFITWLAYLNRLSTGDKMRKWGIQQCCNFCGERNESRDHLFFACPYTFTIWNALSRNFIETGADPDWNETTNTLLSTAGQSMDRILLRLLFQTSIYLIWRERNSRRNQGQWISSDLLTRNIDRTVRNRILSFNYKCPHKLEGLLRRWFIVTGV